MKKVIFYICLFFLLACNKAAQNKVEVCEHVHGDYRSLVPCGWDKETAADKASRLWKDDCLKKGCWVDYTTIDEFCNCNYKSKQAISTPK